MQIIVCLAGCHGRATLTFHVLVNNSLHTVLQHYEQK